MKRLLVAALSLIGHVVVFGALIAISSAPQRGSDPTAGLLAILSLVALIAINRSKARAYAERTYAPPGRAVLYCAIRLGCWWSVFAIFVFLFGALISGAVGVARLLGQSLILFPLAILVSLDVPWRIARRRVKRDPREPIPVYSVDHESNTYRTQVHYPMGSSEARSSNRVVIVSLLFAIPIIAVIAWEVGRRTSEREARPETSTAIATHPGKLPLSSTSRPDPIPVKAGEYIRLVAANEAMAETPILPLRDVIHPIIIIGESWLTFDGEFTTSPEDEDAALRFAVFEGKRRGATSLQLAFRPKYEERLGGYIYESVKLYKPDGTFVYKK